MEAEAAHCRRQASRLVACLGGPTKLDAIVSAFYFNVLRDERVAGFFAHTNIGALLKHQRRFLEFALGGEQPYNGRSLRTAHRRLVSGAGLIDCHFNAFVEILFHTLTSLGYETATAESVIAVIESLRDDVLGRHGN